MLQLNKNIIFMKNYLVSFYCIKGNVWSFKSSNLYDEHSFNRFVKRVKSRGFVFDLECRCFVFSNYFPGSTIKLVYLVSVVPSYL